MPALAREHDRLAETSLRKKAAILGAIIATLGLAVGSLFGDRGVLQLLAQRRRAEALRAEVEAIRAENLRLAAAVVSLREDPRAVEALAREELALARPGETVFLLKTTETPDHP